MSEKTGEPHSRPETPIFLFSETLTIAWLLLSTAARVFLFVPQLLFKLSNGEGPHRRECLEEEK
ncbi:uncharacterized protein G2W53_017876 [Senna tora]|uniref:Uncharacterized protein n=1 Tax=Senna tora TaxID=362788 RepID=A0A834TRP7_9FABA|nr:uncharacterized protein G2W53_017876 [Senna tora]